MKNIYSFKVTKEWVKEELCSNYWNSGLLNKYEAERMKRNIAEQDNVDHHTAQSSR